MKDIIKIVLIMLLVAAATYSRGAVKNGLEKWPERSVFARNRAMSIMATARNKDEFLKAAEAYYQIVQSGGQNAEVFYNLGTALLQAERYAEAEPWLRLAELYGGADWEIERNLGLAARRGKAGSGNNLPWYRTPLFWHFDISMRARGIVATFAFAVFWVALAFRRLTRISHLSGVFAISSLLVLLAFGTSYLASAHQLLKINEVIAEGPVFSGDKP